jgi:hypothetical protein
MAELMNDLEGGGRRQIWVLASNFPGWTNENDHQHEIRTEYSPNNSLERCRNANPFDLACDSKYPNKYLLKSV